MEDCQKLKESILQVSKNLFFEYGIKRVSIDNICNELQVSKKTFYSVFKQKDDLVAEILKEIRETHKKQINIAFDGNVVDYMLTKQQKFKKGGHTKIVHFFFDLIKYYPKINEKHKQEEKAYNLNFTKHFLRKGVEQRLFREDIDMDLMPQFIGNIWESSFSLFGGRKISSEALISFSVDTILRILCNENGLNYYLKKIED